MFNACRSTLKNTVVSYVLKFSDVLTTLGIKLLLITFALRFLRVKKWNLAWICVMTR